MLRAQSCCCQLRYLQILSPQFACVTRPIERRCAHSLLFSARIDPPLPWSMSFIDRALRAQSWSRSRAQGPSRQQHDAPVDTSSSDDDGGSRSVGLVSRVTATDSARRRAVRRDRSMVGSPSTPLPARRTRQSFQSPAADIPDAPDAPTTGGGGGGLSQLAALQHQLEELRTQYPHITAAIRRRQQPPATSTAPASLPAPPPRDSRWRGVDGSRAAAARDPQHQQQPPALGSPPPQRGAMRSLPEPPERRGYEGVRVGGSKGGSEADAAAARRSAAAAAAAAAASAAAKAEADAEAERERAQSAAAPLVTSLALELQVR